MDARGVSPLKKVWIDGLAKGNHIKGKSEAAVGILVKDAEKKEGLSIRIKELLTNNEAEYAALLFAARYLKLMGVKGEDVFIFTDSALVANQMNGVWKTKDKKFVPVQDEIKSLLNDFNVSYIWVSRDKNKEADKLANKAIKDENSALCSMWTEFGSN